MDISSLLLIIMSLRHILTYSINGQFQRLSKLHHECKCSVGSIIFFKRHISEGFDVFSHALFLVLKLQINGLEYIHPILVIGKRIRERERTSKKLLLFYVFLFVASYTFSFEGKIPVFSILLQRSCLYIFVPLTITIILLSLHFYSTILHLFGQYKARYFRSYCNSEKPSGTVTLPAIFSVLLHLSENSPF